MRIKCVAVGDGAVGKTCLLVSYATGSFPYEYEATVHDRYQANVMVNNTMVELDLWDTAGQEDYDQLRPMSYPGTDVFLLCYSVSSVTSFNNARQKWFAELQRHCPGVPIILVATKVDQREDPDVIKQLRNLGRMPVSEGAGMELAAFLNAFAYSECSATEARGLKQTFDLAIRAVYTGRARTGASGGSSSTGFFGGSMGSQNTQTSQYSEPAPPPSMAPTGQSNYTRYQQAQQVQQQPRPVMQQPQQQPMQYQSQQPKAQGTKSNWLINKGKSLRKRFSGNHNTQQAAGTAGGSSQPTFGYKVGKPLGGGWKTALDPSSGEIYYYNKALGASSWDPPPGLGL